MGPLPLHIPGEGYPIMTPSPSPISLTALQSPYMHDKHYQALIDSGAAISLLHHSTYKQIKDCYKTPIQPMAAKLNTADGSPMTTLGSTALHL